MKPQVTVTKLIFFFNDTATTEIYTLSLHDALPILATGFSPPSSQDKIFGMNFGLEPERDLGWDAGIEQRSEEHTSELQSQSNLVCRLLLEKKKSTTKTTLKCIVNSRATVSARSRTI